MSFSLPAVVLASNPFDHGLECEGNSKLALSFSDRLFQMPSSDQPSSFPVPCAPRVLFVDDDASLREVVGRYLRRRGYLVETAVDGAEGLEKITQQCADESAAFDMLITDLRMPNLDGIGLVRALRHNELRLRIIVCSSTFTQPVIDELKSLSVDAVLPKGIMADELAGLVEKLVRSGT